MCESEELFAMQIKTDDCGEQGREKVDLEKEGDEGGRKEGRERKSEDVAKWSFYEVLVGDGTEKKMVESLY